MMSKGIDVSYHNGDIEWSLIKKQIDFAMLRCGYGKNHIDTQFYKNARSCESLSIPFGVYWFSYALNEQMARDEANYCCDCLTNFNILYPVAFDFEYGSENHANKIGKTFTKNERIKIAKAFLNTVEDRGYYPILYTNEDYIVHKGFDALINLYDVWYAQYTQNEKPKRECEIWQKGTINIGNLTKVDFNICFKDYPSIINPYYNVHDLDADDINYIINESDLFYLNRDYINLAYEIINGKYGTGTERMKKIEAMGYNYAIAQSVVNTIMHKQG